MTIYLVCKHQRFTDRYGSGYYKAFTLHNYCYTKDIAKFQADDLNKRSKKYFYKIRKIGI